MSDPITRLNAALEGRSRVERELGEGGNLGGRGGTGVTDGLFPAQRRLPARPARRMLTSV